MSKIGAGGMGEVYLAEDVRLDRKAAIKLLPDEWADDDERRRRFFKEAKAASALNHPHVCVIYDVGEATNERPYIAMEYIEGTALASFVRQGPLEIGRIVDIGIQVADALDTAHENAIVHRDIKPDNISVDDRGRVKVLEMRRSLANGTPVIERQFNEIRQGGRLPKFHDQWLVAEILRRQAETLIKGTAK